MAARPLAAAVLVLGLLAPSAAVAHPLVDGAAVRLRNADFAGALDLLAAAADQDDLTAEDLARLLEVRALAHRALADEASTQDDLRMLAALDPTYSIDPTAPPEFRLAFEQAVREVGGAVSVEASHAYQDGQVQIDAWIDEDPATIIRALHVYARLGDAPWRGPGENRLRMAVSQDARVDYYVEAVGAGGAPVAGVGRRDRPRQVSLLEDGPGQAGSETPWLWVGAGVGAALLVVVIVAVVIAGAAQDDTVLEGPFPSG